MKKNEKDEGLQSRREFFKNAAKGTLPILGISLFASSILTSCGEDKPSTTSNSGKSGKSSCSCSNTCSGSCDGDCAGNCDGCTGSCDASACKYM